MRKRTTLLVAGALAIALGARADATIVSSCGDEFNGNAELGADLDCSGHDGDSITLTKGTLRLGGFTLTGHPDHTVVHCPGGCKIKGPGTITGGRNGIEGVSPVRVFDVTLTGNSGVGVTGSIVRLLRCTVTNNGSPNTPTFEFTGGAHASNRLVVARSTIQNNFNFGLHTATATVGRATTITGNGVNPDCAASPYATSLRLCRPRSEQLAPWSSSPQGKPVRPQPTVVCRAR